MKKFLQSKDSQKLRVLIALCGLVLLAFTNKALAQEPTNHVTGFTATATSRTSIDLDWTGSTGADLPTDYLILAVITGGIQISVVDGSAVADDNDFTDPNTDGAVNVTHVVGANSYSWTGLDPGTTYDFEIYPYTTGGAPDPDYKTDATVPTASATTLNEPTNHVTGFTATPTSGTSIDLDWTDATGGEVPTNYLILAIITGGTQKAVVDGSSVADDNDFTDPNTNGAINVSHVGGTNSYSWTGLDLSTTYEFEIYPYFTGGTPDPDYKTDGTIPTASALTTDEPPNHVTSFTATPTSATSIDLDWTDATGSPSPTNYLIIARITGGTFKSVTDGSTVADDSDFTDPNTDGAINVAHVGGANSYSWMGLDPSTTYDFEIYPYTTGGTPDPDYKTNGTVPSTSATTPNEPPNHVTGFTATATSETAIDLDWTDATGSPAPTNYLILAIITGGTQKTVTDGSSVADDNDFTDPNTDGATNVVHIGAANSYSWTGLDPNTTYDFEIYPYASGGSPDPDYKTNGTVPTSSATTLNEPPNHVTLFSATTTSNTSIDLNWTDGTGSPAPTNYLILAIITGGTQKTAADNSAVVDDNDFTDPNTDGAINVAHVGGANSYSWTGLDINTTYEFEIYPYTTGGVSDPDYKTDGTIPTASATTTNEPPNHVTSFTATPFSDSQIDLDWTDATDSPAPTNYLILAIKSGGTQKTVSDGSSVADDNDFTDPNTDGAINVAHVGGANSYSWTGLDVATTYEFEIYPYATGGTPDPDYKTNGTIPTANASTNCTAPTTQPNTLVFSAETASSMTVSWTDGDGDGVIVVVHAGSAPTFIPSSGNNYAADIDSDYSAATEQTDGRIVYRGNAGTVDITGLDPSITYHFVLYSYFNTNECYLIASQLTGNNPTNAAGATTTLSAGSGAAEIRTIDNTEVEGVAVFTFTVTDQGDDNDVTDITEMIFRPGTGNTVTDWSAAIEGVKLYDGVDDGNHNAPVITSNTITIPTIRKGNGQLGQVDDGTSKNYTLRIWLKTTYGATETLPNSVEGKRFVFDLHEDDISRDGNDTDFLPNTNTNSDADAGTNNVVSIEPFDYNFLQQPPTNVIAGTSVSPQPSIEVVDEYGNRDLNYTTTTLNITNAGSIPMSNLPGAGDFSLGVLTFPVNFTYDGVGDGTLTITDGDVPSVTETSNSVTVDPSADSDIIESTTGFSYPSDIDYAATANQGDVVTSSSIKVFQLEIRDGGGSDDADGQPTILTDLQLQLTDVDGVINKVGLFDDTDALIQQQDAGGTITFAGIGGASTTATDPAGTKTIHLRVTFNSVSVADNAQFSFLVTSATADPANSDFATSDAGAATTTTMNQELQIEVFTTQFIYTTQPSPFIRLTESLTVQGANIPVLEARDQLNNFDEDFGSLATISNPDNITTNYPTISWSGGFLNFPTDFTYTAFTAGDPGDGTLTVTVGGINVTSNAVVVDGTPPTVNIAGVEIGAGLLNDEIVRDGNSVAFTVTFTEGDQIDETPFPRISIDEPGGNIVDVALVKTTNLIWTYTWNVTGGLDETNVTVTITAFDRAGHPIGTHSGDILYEIDNTVPTLGDVTIVSNSTDPTYANDPLFAKLGDVITLTFTADDDLEALPIVTIDSKDALESGTPALFTATYTTQTGDTQGSALLFTIDFTDAAGNVGSQVTAVSGTGIGSSVTFDEIPPILTTLLPADNFLSIPVDAPLKITLNDNLIPNINNSAQIRIKELVGDAIIETFSDIVNNTQVSFSGNEVTITPTSNFAPGTGYYVEIDGGSDAIFDKAGNPYTGFVDNTTWNFQTFKTAEITDIVGNISNSICVEDVITIFGKYFAGYSATGSETAGVTQIEFIEITSGDIATGTNITVISDTELTVKIPAGMDEDIQVRFTKNTENTGIGINPTTVSIISPDIVAVGPSTAEFDFATDGTGRTTVCSDGTSTSNILVTIFGGNGPYTLNYRVNDPNLDQGKPTITINGYNSGDFINVDPPLEGNNDYTIESLIDANGCAVPVSGFTTRTITINQIDRSFVTINPITTPANPVCLVGLNTGDPITITGTITGTNQQVKWSSINGTGIFTESGGSEYIVTSGDGTLTANYELTAQDLALDPLIIRVESINSTSPCAETSDQIDIFFTVSQSANLGGDQEICKTVSNPSIDLNGALGGGSINGYWEAISAGPNIGGDGTWTFGPGSSGAPLADGDDGTTDGVMSNTYVMGNNDVLNGSLQIRLVPGGGSCGTPLDDIINVNIQDLPVPQKVGNVFSADPCVESTFVDYEIVNTSGSTYAWSIIPDPAITNPVPLPSDVADIISGQGTNKIFVNWKGLNGNHQVEVIETNQFNCLSDPVLFNVTVHPLPPVAFALPLVRNFSKDAANVLLSGVPHPFITDPFPDEPGSRRDSLFLGPGVIVDFSGNYAFDPDIAGSGVTHDITYQYTNDYGCTNQVTEQFSVFDASASVVLVDDPLTPLDLEYCEDFGVLHIRISDTFLPDPGFEFHEFTGPGITDNGDGTAFYDPLFAADSTGTGVNRVGGEKKIVYTQREIGNETNVIDWGEQFTTVNLVPTLSPIISQTDFCSHDPELILTRDQGLNPLASFSFFVVGADSTNTLITESAGPVFTLIPGNEFFTPDDFTAHVITIGYAYEDNTSTTCNDTTTFEITINQRPPAPTSPNIFGCIGDTDFELTVTDQVTGANIKWYTSSSLDPETLEASSAIFKPIVTGDVSYWVTQEINLCESLSTEVPITVTTVLEKDLGITLLGGAACIDEGTQFFGTAILENTLDIVLWEWDFGDGDNETGTGQNPVHVYAEPGNYLVSLIVTNIGGCQNLTPLTQPITVGSQPVVELDYTGICAGQSSIYNNLTIDTESAISDSIIWTFMDWERNIVDQIFEADQSKLTDDISYTYVVSGRKRVALTVFTTTGCVSSDTLELFILPSITVTTDDFYDAEDFELTADQWIAWGDAQEDFASSWRYALPAGSTITPLDGEAWVTNPDGAYPADDASVIYSPCFDISGLIRPMVGFSSFTDANKGQDGAVFQYSADGKFDNWNTIGTNSSGINWYHQADITNIPGSLESNRNAYGWSQEFSGWQESKQSIGTSTIPEDVRSHVIFRFAFNSGANQDFDGFAFDNFFIAERSRIVVLEHFENLSETSRIQTDFIPDISSDENELINLQYRAGDEPLFSSEVNARMEYYGITTAPYAIFDGIETNTEPLDQWGVSAFDFRSLNNPKVKIQISNAQSNSGELSVITQVEAIEDINDPFIIITAIIERDANGLKNVVRKMLPDASGKRIENLMKSDAPIAASYSWPLSNLDPVSELDIAIVAFVQDLETNEILQSAVRDIDETLIITGLDELTNGTKYLLYPNPASDKVTLMFMKPAENDINLKIYDQFGKLIFSQLIKTGEYQTGISVNKYAIGVYLLQLETNSEILLRSKFIISH